MNTIVTPGNTPYVATLSEASQVVSRHITAANEGHRLPALIRERT